jgi:hypothetical protein
MAGLSRRVDANESRTAGKTTTPPVRPDTGGHVDNPCIPKLFTGLPYMLAMVADALYEVVAGILGSNLPCFRHGFRASLGDRWSGSCHHSIAIFQKVLFGILGPSSLLLS